MKTILFLLFRFDEMKEIIRLLKNHKKIKDMSNVLNGLY